MHVSYGSSPAQTQVCPSSGGDRLITLRWLYASLSSPLARFVVSLRVVLLSLRHCSLRLGCIYIYIYIYRVYVYIYTSSQPFKNALRCTFFSSSWWWSDARATANEAPGISKERGDGWLSKNFWKVWRVCVCVCTVIFRNWFLILQKFVRAEREITQAIYSLR